MIELAGKRLRLAMREDGTGVEIDDLSRGVLWRLDEATRLATRSSPRFECESWRAGRGGDAVFPLGPGNARREGPATIMAVHDGPGGRVVLRWILESDRVRVVVDPVPDGANGLSLPGTFRPADGAGFHSAVPIGQGVLHFGEGPSFFRPLTISGHGDGYTLSVFGQIAPRGGLAVIAEAATDAALHWEKSDRVDLMWVQHPSLGTLGYPRETAVVPVDPSVAAVCKAFRRHEIAAGRFKSWDAKIAERPALEKLFGAAVVFTGYLQDRELDYPAAFRKLKAAGIDRAYVLPVWMASTLEMGEVMGGPPADLREHIPLLHELGWLAGSFIYVQDGPKGDGADLRLDREGNPQLKWEIEEKQWWSLGAERRAAWARKLLDSGHAGLDAVHFDVLTCVRFQEDWRPARRADARDEEAAVRGVLADATRRGLVVASEGFLDRMTPDYDIGSTKLAHGTCLGEYCTVPMTMLVYHDSAIHTWWEVDNYNNPEHRTQFGRGLSSRFWWGGGNPRLQAAIDASMGTPPDIFPFGMQYCFVPHSHPKTYAYKPSPGDAAVREAIEYAKPVMALNRRVGRQELVDHKLLTPDGAVQETVFTDGTRVVANFADTAREAPGGPVLPPQSWTAD